MLSPVLYSEIKSSFYPLQGHDLLTLLGFNSPYYQREHSFSRLFEGVLSNTILNFHLDKDGVSYLADSLFCFSDICDKLTSSYVIVGCLYRLHDALKFMYLLLSFVKLHLYSNKSTRVYHNGDNS